MKRIVSVVIMFLNLSLVTEAVSHPVIDIRPEERVTIYQSLLDLTYPFTIMCVAAHPDDEDREALAYYRMKYGARTVIVTATRGEGGQNSDGAELYEELGVLRMKEMSAVARHLDAITFNMAMPDFGFSKTAEETFEKWNRKEALRRMVYAIRYYQPDIIITQHDRKTGHGHHQATRILAEEAFNVAADRYAYPEQISARLEPWQTKRFFVRTLNKERFDTEFDVNETVGEKQFSRIAYEALLNHRTQGPWPQIEFKGERMARYNLVKNVEGDFRRWYQFDENLTRPAIYTRVQPLLFDESAVGPEQAVGLARQELIARLVKALNLVRSYLKEEEGKQDNKARELEAKLVHALVIAAKITFTISTDKEKVAQGLDIAAKPTLVNDGTEPLQITDLRLGVPEGWDYKEMGKLAATLEPGSNTKAEYSVTVSQQAAITVPAKAHIYDLDFLEPQIGAVAKVSLKDLSEPIAIVARARVEIAPAVELELSPNNIPVNVIDAGQTDSYTLQAKIINNLPTGFRGRLMVAQNPPLRVAPEEQQFDVGPSATVNVTFLVTIGRPTPEGTVLLPVTLSDNYGRVLANLPLALHLINLRVSPRVRVGYVRSFDFTIPQTLQFFSLPNTELSAAEIGAGKLNARFDTIVLDNRAYLAHPELVKLNGKLLDFVRNGGTLIVWYQRPGDWNQAMLSPYPIKLGDERITDENAPVTILQPDHVLMNRPNKIGAEDFNNWIQERGLSFPISWDEHYQTLLSSSDPGEEALKGGLLIADYGRGKYIYTSYVIYRQLRLFVPGAYRIFANMVSLPSNR